MTTVLNLEKLKDMTCVQEYEVTVSNWFGAPDTLEDPVDLLRLPRNALLSAQDHRVASSWWRQWTMLRRVTLSDLLESATSTGLCHVGQELS